MATDNVANLLQVLGDAAEGKIELPKPIDLRPEHPRVVDGSPIEDDMTSPLPGLTLRPVGVIQYGPTE